MKVKKLILEICKREKLKKQVDIAQVTEIVGHLSDLFWEAVEEDDTCFWTELGELGEKRAKAKAKKKT